MDSLYSDRATALVRTLENLRERARAETRYDVTALLDVTLREVAEVYRRIRAFSLPWTEQEPPISTLMLELLRALGASLPPADPRLALWFKPRGEWLHDWSLLAEEAVGVVLRHGLEVGALHEPATHDRLSMAGIAPGAGLMDTLGAMIPSWHGASWRSLRRRLPQGDDWGDMALLPADGTALTVPVIRVRIRTVASLSPVWEIPVGDPGVAPALSALTTLQRAIDLHPLRGHFLAQLGDAPMRAFHAVLSRRRQPGEAVVDLARAIDPHTEPMLTPRGEHTTLFTALDGAASRTRRPHLRFI